MRRRLADKQRIIVTTETLNSVTIPAGTARAEQGIIDSASPSYPAVRWEKVACNLCGREEADLYHRERLAYFDKRLDFRIVRCRQCGLVYTNPRLAHHNATYLLAGHDDDAAMETHARTKRKVFESALDEIERQRQRLDGSAGAKLLDIGCGSGHFCAAALRHGFQVCGIEPAEAPARYAAERLGVEVIAGDVFEVEMPTGQFDVITAWDVIEHVADPRAMLRRCVEWLRPGGIMALRFPSARWQKIKALILHQLLSSKRAAFAPTIHLTFFSEQTFAQMAQQVGLEVLRTVTTPAEANTGKAAIDAAKILSHKLIRALEIVSGSHLGNLEVYCHKPIS